MVENSKRSGSPEERDLKTALRAFIKRLDEHARLDHKEAKDAEKSGDKHRAGYMTGNAESAEWCANKLRAIVAGKDPDAAVKALVAKALKGAKTKEDFE